MKVIDSSLLDNISGGRGNNGGDRSDNGGGRGGANGNSGNDRQHNSYTQSNRGSGSQANHFGRPGGMKGGDCGCTGGMRTC
ncbi:hypothetical protein QZQ97_20025 [Serratia sp. root2]|uniref:hypothetical protein n=1 Tax=Serratia TaxID=613 RepID=UPI001305355B|nr:MULTISPECIES: hypothetical protein [Serratia]MDT3253211.1 hypothetical protein [Serratia sp. root2]UTN96805.1 hypothetical protein NLX81_00340 [Serratia plymuthica]